MRRRSAYSANCRTRNDDPDDIRGALTQHETAGTDKRARFVSVAAYEEAGGAVRRDLFAEGDEGVFLLDSGLLDRLATGETSRAGRSAETRGLEVG